MKNDQQNKEVIGARTRQTTKRATKKTSDKEQNQENDQIVNMKGQKRSISATTINTRKRTAFGDITNAIQAHSNRMSIARSKSVNLKGMKCPEVKKTSLNVIKEVKGQIQKTKHVPTKRKVLKQSQSTSSIPVSVEDVKAVDKEMTISEQCDDILSTEQCADSTNDLLVEEMDTCSNSSFEVPELPEGVVPFDLDEDPNVVSEYAADIFKNMRKRETKYPVTNYLSQQGTLTTGMMRAILVDWLVEVQENFELYHETLYFAVKLVDYYLQHNSTPKEKLQLVGATSLLIACKIEERQPPPLDDFQFICDDAYTNKQFMEMEMKIFKALNFDINMPISYRFLRRFSRVNTLQMDVLTLARYILELSLHAAEFVDKPPSKMAASCLCLAMKMKSAGEWNSNHSYHTGYTEKDLIEEMKLLNEMLIDAPTHKLQTVRTKYSHPIHFEVAKTLTIDPRSL